MRSIWLTVAVAIMAVLMVAPYVAAQQQPNLQINWLLMRGGGDGTKDNPYQVPPHGVDIPIYANLIWPDHQAFHIEEVSIDIWHIGGGDTTWDWQWLAGYCQWHDVGYWFPWGVLTIDGTYCNTVAIVADLIGTGDTGEPFGPIWSNELYFHVVPEPAAFTSLAGLLLGAGWIGWRRLRRR
jgi:hypothetical protein